jgi:squalene-hopene/tetraprenyl-beta-curcumene cyclase
MSTSKKVSTMMTDLVFHLQRMREEGCNWEGHLSSSAISTSVSLFALYLADEKQYADYILKGKGWLKRGMRPDGSWGDSPESPSNMTATLLAYAFLYALGEASPKTEAYLSERFGGVDERHLMAGVLAYYGSDLTFSAPILVTCALAGLVRSWNKIPQLPFELAVLPQRFFRFLRLPVVSYAIPALIAVGVLRYVKGKRGLLSPLRAHFLPAALAVLERLQPEDGGFLEAAPLTAFVAICLTAAGYKGQPAVGKALDFLTGSVRSDGSWPIDTSLSSWVNVLCIRARGRKLGSTKVRERMTELIRQEAFT